MPMCTGRAVALVAGAMAVAGACGAQGDPNAAPIGGTPHPNTPVVRGAATYSAKIVLEDGTPLPSIPQISGCAIVNVFRNGTVVYTAGPGDITVHDARSDGCLATIMLPGFRSVHATLRDGAVIVLKRLGANEGSTISMTVLKAPEKARKAYESGAAAMWNKKWAAAQKEFERAVAVYPDYALAWSELGEALKRQSKHEEARAAYGRALEADPKYIKPYVQLAALALEQEKWEDASAITDRAMKLNPVEFPAVFYYHGVASFDLGRMDAAEKSARRAIELDTHQSFPRAEYVLGAALAARGETARAIEHFRAYLALVPNAEDAAKVKERIAALEHGGTPQVSPEDLKKARAEIANLKGALADSPEPALALFEIAQNHARIGENSAALAALRESVALCRDLDLDWASEFAPLHGLPEFDALRKQAGQATPPVRNSRVAFTIPERDLIPEGMAYDPVRRNVYLGSIHKHKIIEIRQDGSYRDLVKPRQDGLEEVLGMKVGADGATLWAASNGKGGSAVFRFDLRTGRLVRRYPVAGKHLLNDLVIASDGNVYVTDSAGGTIFRFSRESGSVEDFGAGMGLIYPNGIALSDDERTLFVADSSRGMSVIDVAPRRIRTMGRPRGVTLATIDGLYFHQGTLIAIQNVVVTNRVVRLFLNVALDRVEKVDVLERRNPLFNAPTTGALAPGAFYYIANSHIPNLKGEELVRPEELRPVTILKLDLK